MSGGCNKFYDANAMDLQQRHAVSVLFHSLEGATGLVLMSRSACRRVAVAATVWNPDSRRHGKEGSVRRSNSVCSLSLVAICNFKNIKMIGKLNQIDQTT